jgi:hypothetical protein
LLAAVAAVLLIGVGRPAAANPIRSDGDHGHHGIALNDHHDDDHSVSFYDHREVGGSGSEHFEDGDDDADHGVSWWNDDDHEGWRPHDGDYGDGDHEHHDCKPVPEPGTFALMMLGLVGMVARKR